jgi:hypothetical protein
VGRSWFERGEVAARNWLLGWAKSEPPNNARLGAVNVTWQSRTESHRVAPTLACTPGPPAKSYFGADLPLPNGACHLDPRTLICAQARQKWHPQTTHGLNWDRQKKGYKYNIHPSACGAMCWSGA